MIKIFIIACLFTHTCINSIYDYDVPVIEGGNKTLAQYSTKKLLIITLPVTQGAAADSLLYSLDTLAHAHLATHQVIGVPSTEDGFTPDNKATLMQWYRSKLDSNILITDGLYTRKSSGNNQHGLFQWLTNATKNGIFDIEVEGPGQKFFVTAGGQLYGMLHAEFRTGSAIVHKVLMAIPETD